MGTTMDASDEDLMMRLAGGEEEALAVLMRRWEAPLARYVRRRCYTCGPETDDILQEAFLQVYRHVHAFDPSLRFSSWIYRIVHNAMVSKIRRHARTSDHLALEEEALMVPNGLTADAELSGKQLDAQVREILETLSEALREAFVLRFLEEKSYEEIGDILHLNPNTVATRIRRARTEFVEKARKRGLSLEGGE